MDPMLVTLTTAAVTAGAAFGAVRSAMNGTVKRVERIERRTDTIESAITRIAENVAFIRGQTGIKE